MTKEEMAELKCVLRRAFEEEREMYNEVWLTEDKLLEQFGMFSPSWVKTYGHLLPRKKAVVYDAEGKPCKSRWAYARNKIQRMIQSGEMQQLKIRRSEDMTRVYGGVLVG